jgi:hypothetical protein
MGDRIERAPGMCFTVIFEKNSALEWRALLGSWTLPKTEPTPCFSCHQLAELALALPPGRDIELLPSGKTVENPYLRYESNWHRDGQIVTVRREVRVKSPVAACRDEIRSQLAEAIAEIGGDYRDEIALKPLAH